MINPKEYFSEKYLQDQKIYTESVKKYSTDAHVCGRLVSSLFHDDNFEKFVDIKSYFICQYELNLIGQVIFTHFSIDFDMWKSLVPKYADCRCTYGSHPIEILRHAEHQSENYNDIVFTRSDILEWDKFFLRYMDNLCKSNNFQSLTLERMIEAIKNDPDCNNDYIKEYFANKK